MSLKLDKESIDQNKDFMRSHRESFPIHIRQARVKDIDANGYWVEYDIDEKGKYIDDSEVILKRAI